MKRAAQSTETPQVGRSVPRLESWLKVTGRAEYVHTLRLPGMLYGKIFRSTVAHGRIKRIDADAAQQLAGVYRVITAKEIRDVVPEPYYGPAFHDQPILALDKVRYVGEPVAVVLASDPHVAEEAVHLISAEYEALPAVYDELEAMSSKAIVHEALKPAGTFPDLKHLKGRTHTNVALDFHLRRGNASEAMKTAHRVFDHRFRTQQVMHTPLEPLVSVAESTEGSLTIHTASQSPSFVRIEIARLLGWPENRVRVRVPFLGGGFGAKLYIKLEALVAVLSLITRRPVKISLTMEEQFFTITKHASTVHIKSGVDKEGRIDLPHQDRRRPGRQDRRARMRSVVERRRLCRHRPARDPEIGLHRPGTVRHRARRHRFLRALYQPAARRSAARLRHPATGLGVREPHRHDGA